MLHGQPMSCDSPGSAPDTRRATESLLIDTSSVPFDFEVLWTEVDAICQAILGWETSASTCSTQAMASAVTKAYVLVYHLVSHPCVNIPRVHFDGKDQSEGQQALAVYLRFCKVLQNHLTRNVLPRIQGLADSGASLMEVYLQQWRSFLVAVTNLKTVFSSLAPTWNSLGFAENPFERIEDIALNNWAQTILDPNTQRQLRTELAAYVTQERKDGKASRKGRFVTELRDVLAMLPDQGYYKTILESTYLADLRKHYADKAKTLSTKDVYAYAMDALNCIEVESERAGKYLQSNKLAIDQLVNVLVEENMGFFQRSSFADWMGDWKSPELREKVYSMYNLLSRSRRVGLPFLEERFTNSVVEMTAKEIQATVREGGRDGYGSIIRAFLGVIKRLRDAVTDAFHEDACMVEAMENGLRHGLFVGGRDVIDYRALAERLAALFCGTFLPAERRPQEQMSIEDVVCVYFFLPDAEPSAKEVFLVLYQKQLARRLLSDEYNLALEQQALYLLVQVKQSPILFACRTMVRAVSKGVVFAAGTRLNGVDYRTAVLAKGTWPAVPTVSMALPDHLTTALQTLEANAAKSLPGQRIALAAPLSYGVVRMKLPDGAAQPSVLLKLNLLQICLVDQINKRPLWRFEELCEALGCSRKECARALAPFVAVKIIECEMPPTGPSEVKLGAAPVIPAEATQLTLIPEVTQVELLPSPGSSDTLGTKAVTRLHPQAVETCVMKCLKSQGSKSLDAIHEHVSRTLSPNIVTRKDLKAALEKLLAREFVLREEDTRKFRHLP